MRYARLVVVLVGLVSVAPSWGATAPVNATNVSLEGSSCSTTLNPINMVSVVTASGRRLRCKAGLWLADDIPPCNPDPPTGACTGDPVCQVKSGTGIQLHGCKSGSWQVIGGAGGASPSGNSGDVQLNAGAGFGVAPGFNAGAGGGVTTKILNGTRLARQYVTGGAGTLLSPYTGWTSAIAASTTLRFTGNDDGTIAYYDFQDAGTSLPSGITLEGDGKAALTWGTAASAPWGRASINPGFTIPGGVTDVTVRGLIFDPGVPMNTLMFCEGPSYNCLGGTGAGCGVTACSSDADCSSGDYGQCSAYGLRTCAQAPTQVGCGTGGGSYFQVGTQNSSTPARRIKFLDNTFGPMRYSAGADIYFQDPSGLDVFIVGSAADLQFAGNTVDAAPSNLGSPCSSSVQQTIDDVTIDRNTFAFSIHYHDYGGLTNNGIGCLGGALSGAETVWNRFTVTNNIATGVNGAFGSASPGEGRKYANNTITSEMMDGCIFIAGNALTPPSTLRQSNVLIEGNTCSSDTTFRTGPRHLGTGSADITVSVADNVVVQNNHLYGDGGAYGIGSNGATNLLIANNMIDISATAALNTDGIMVATGTGVRVEGNTIRNASHNGINVQGSSLVVVDNTVMDTNTTSILTLPISSTGTPTLLADNTMYLLSAPSSGTWYSPSVSAPGYEVHGNVTSSGAGNVGTPTWTGYMVGQFTNAGYTAFGNDLLQANNVVYGSDGINAEGPGPAGTANWHLVYPATIAANASATFSALRSGYVAMSGVETLGDGCAQIASGLLTSTGVGCGSGTGGGITPVGSPVQNQIAVWETPTSVRGQSTATVDPSGNAAFQTLQSADAGDGARRLRLFGNVSDLSGAALPSLGPPAQVAFYAIGAAGFETPAYRNASVGRYNLLTDRSVAGGALAGMFPNPTIGNSGVTPGTYPMADVQIGADGRVAGAVDGSTSTRALSNKTIDGGDSGSGTTRPPGSNIEQIRRHTSDCTILVDGVAGEQCVDLDDGRIWVCVPTPTAGPCDTFGEWKRVDASGGSGLTSGLVQLTVNSPTSSTDEPMFYTTQAVQIDTLVAQLTGSSQSVTWDLVYARTANASTTGAVGTSSTSTIGAAGTLVSMSAPVIPKDAWVRLKASAASGTNTRLFAQAAYSAATAAQCNDGVDNDSNGLIDYPADTTGCASATDNSESTSDTTAPEALTGPNAGSPTSSTCALSWAAPHEDGGSGGAVASYDCRVCAQSVCSTTMDNTEFGNATGSVGTASGWQLTGEPSTPASPGSTDSFTATSLNASTAYVFGCKSSDEVPNTSAISTGGTPTCTTSAAASYTDILLWVNFEAADNTGDYNLDTSASATHEYSAGDTSGAYTANASCSDPGVCVDATSSKSGIGTYGLHVQGSAADAEVMQFAVSSQDILKHTGGVIGFWKYEVALSNNARNIFSVHSPGTNNLIWGPTDTAPPTGYEAVVDDADGATTNPDVFTTADIWTTGVWYFFQFKWNSAASPYLELKVYTDGGSTDTRSDTTHAFTTTNMAFDLLNLGETSTGAAREAYYDNLMISSDVTRNFIVDTAPCGSGGATVALMNCVKSPR